ncbi:tellurite resistance TerB family protein [Marinomonas epiphytica]
MLEVLKKLFATEGQTQEQILSYQEAVAALLVEVMMADHQIDENELLQIKRLLKEVTELGANIDALIESAKQGVDEANDLYQFTKVVNEQADHEQKFRLLKGLWLVAMSDGHVDSYEDHRIRRISELLFMPHSEFIQAKLAAQQDQ